MNQDNQSFETTSTSISSSDPLDSSGGERCEKLHQAHRDRNGVDYDRNIQLLEQPHPLAGQTSEPVAFVSGHSGCTSKRPLQAKKLDEAQALQIFLSRPTSAQLNIAHRKTAVIARAFKVRTSPPLSAHVVVFVRTTVKHTTQAESLETV